MSTSAILAPPRCPHCATELPAVQLYNWQFSSWMILAVYCGHDPCRKLLHLQVVPAMAAEDPRSALLPRA